MKCRTKAVGLRRLYPAFLNAVLLNWFSQDLTQFYGQSAFFCWFVRKQNAFYGQTGIFQWFVRKFLAIMMEIYGQTPHFHRYVRKRQWFFKIQRSFSQHAKPSVKITDTFCFGLFPSWKAIVMHTQKSRMICNLRHGFFQHLHLYQLHIKPSFL